ncbi:hypothetical protein [Rhizobium sp. BR 314]|uniref:hypothetical protein n=1 Tax=Rhizobium sp. BR 314 TaxID=3040013 RepID=UPI0039BF03CD
MATTVGRHFSVDMGINAMHMNRTAMFSVIAMGLLSTAAIEKASALQHTARAMVVNIASDDDLTAIDEDDTAGIDSRDNDDQGDDDESGQLGSDYDLGGHD